MPTDLPSFLLLLGRLLIGGAFLYAAYGNLRHFDKAAGFMAARGVPQPRLVMGVGLVVHAVSSLMVLFGTWTALGAAGLLVFVVLATLLYHNFWAFSGPDRFNKRNSFNANLIIAGGLLVLLAASL
ncbi:DoxX family protein [Devosia sp.]|uniref:DoxX family protein n=1 Tax=Devosia sp. TaxID=1871048 RepID=UPI002F0A3A6A